MGNSQVTIWVSGTSWSSSKTYLPPPEVTASGRIDAEAPAGDVDAVDAVVAELAGPPVPEPVPVVVEPVRDEGPVGGGALPHRVIDARRDRAGLAVADRLALLVDPGAGHADLADRARRGRARSPSLTCGMLRRWVPTWTTRLYFRAASTIRRPSTTLWLAGFST